MKEKHIIPIFCAFPALGNFLSFYLDGRGVLEGYGLLWSAFFTFVLPIPLAIFMTFNFTKQGEKRAHRVAHFILLQWLILWIFPAGATSETIGFAHKLKKEYSTTDLRKTAEQILQKYENGTLSVQKIPEGDERLFRYASILVDKSELPTNLRGKFQFIAIVEETASQCTEILFALGPRTGIVCNAIPREYGFFRCSMDKGVHAYRYQRL